MAGSTIPIFIRAAERYGIAVEELFCGLAIRPEEPPPRWFLWDEFCELIERLVHVVGVEELANLGATILDYGGKKMLIHVLGLGVHPRTLYYASQRWNGPRLCPASDATYEELSDRELRLGLSLPDDVRDCPGFFHMNLGFNRSLPSLLGLPCAHVHMELRERGATYHVVLPPSRNIPHRVRRALHVVVGREDEGMREAFQQLANQNDDLRRRFREAEDAREAARRSEAGLEQLLASMTDGVLVFDEAWCAARVNEAACRLLSRSPEELLGRALDEIAAGDLEVFRSLTEADTEARGVRMEMRGADGGTVPVSVDAVRMQTSEGTPQVLLVTHDLRGIRRLERESVERQLAEARAEEARHALSKIQDVNRELRRLQAELVQSSRLTALGTLAAGIAHEINQPLTAIHSLTWLLGSEPDSKVGKHTESIDLVLEAASRISEIVDAVRIFGRESAIEPQALPAASPVQGALTLTSKQIRVRGVNVHREIEGNLPVIRGDQGRLQQVALNLLSNAADAAASLEEGEPREVHVRVSRGVDEVIYEFEDNGPGVPADVAERIFDPFFTTKPVGKGMGVGLSISHGIVEEHGGTLRLESSAPGRTLFIFTLPIAERNED